VARYGRDVPMSDKKTKNFSVPASPFNGIKLDIGIFACIGIILLIVLESTAVSPLTELLWLAGFGLFVLGWVYVRARRVYARLQAGRYRNARQAEPD